MTLRLAYTRGYWIGGKRGTETVCWECGRGTGSIIRDLTVIECHHDIGECDCALHTCNECGRLLRPRIMRKIEGTRSRDAELDVQLRQPQQPRRTRTATITIPLNSGTSVEITADSIEIEWEVEV